MTPLFSPRYCPLSERSQWVSIQTAFLTFIAFYIPACPAYQELHDKIIRNGGYVVEQHECFTYQLKPENSKSGFSEFYIGKIHSGKWITDSITCGKCQPADTYFVCINSSDSARKLNIGKKKKYTVIEGMKLYELITN